MILNEKYEYVPLSQRDGRWKDILLGNSNKATIGGFGCLITSLTIMLNYYGYKETPLTVNNKLKNKGGFVKDLENMYWGAPPTIWNINLDYFREPYFAPAPLDVIDKYLLNDTPVLAHVDFNMTTFQIEQHWILLTKKLGNDYQAIDPWDGKFIKFKSKYGEPSKGIYRIAIYTKGK